MRWTGWCRTSQSHVLPRTGPFVPDEGDNIWCSVPPFPAPVPGLSQHRKIPWVHRAVPPPGTDTRPLPQIAPVRPRGGDIPPAGQCWGYNTRSSVQNVPPAVPAWRWNKAHSRHGAEAAGAAPGPPAAAAPVPFRAGN